MPDGVPPTPKRTYTTFAALVRGREVEFPTLATAVVGSYPANSTKIAWMTPDGTVWENHTQIIRFPYEGAAPEGSEGSGNDGDASEALFKFLAAIECALVDGIPGHAAHTRTCGGYRHYLHRELVEDGDVLRLRPLREPFLWEFDHAYDPNTDSWTELRSPRFEWLAEFSLEVSPGK